MSGSLKGKHEADKDVTEEKGKRRLSKRGKTVAVVVAAAVALAAVFAGSQLYLQQQAQANDRVSSRVGELMSANSLDSALNPGTPATQQGTDAVEGQPTAKDYQSLIDAANSAPSTGSLQVFGASQSLPLASELTLNAKLKSISSHYELSVMMVDLTTGEGISFNPDARIYSASAIKGPYVASINKLNSSGAKAHASTIERVITVSDNEGYDSLRRSFGGSTFGTYAHDANVTAFDPVHWYVYTGARDFAKLWIENYDYFYVHPNENSEWARGLYSDTLNSVIHQGVGSRYSVDSKAGWFAGEYNVLNDAGIVFSEVNGESHPYVLAIFSSAADQYDLLADLVQSVDDVHTDMVASEQR